MKIYLKDLDEFEVYTHKEMSEKDKDFDMGKFAYELFARAALKRFKKVFKESGTKEVASMTMDFRNPFKLPHIAASIVSNGVGEDDS